jgi:hypothetical protein
MQQTCLVALGHAGPFWSNGSGTWYKPGRDSHYTDRAVAPAAPAQAIMLAGPFLLAEIVGTPL